MLERRYKLDKEKTKGISAAYLAFPLDTKRHTIWAWLQGKNHIPETIFLKLMEATGRKPAELLDQESLEYFANASISY